MIVLGALPVLFLLQSGVVTSRTIDTIRVKVHGHEMALYRSGTGGPTLVLESGGGSSHRAFNALVPQLAQHTRVIAYDRPGYGLSAPCDSPRTALRIANELKTALATAGVQGPYFLGGWSFGGFVVRVFAGEFPQLTAGLLLIDPAPEDFYARAAREASDQYTLEDEDYLPALFSDSSRRAEQRETAAYAASTEQARVSDSKHAAPTLVLVAGRDANGQPDRLWLIWIEELRRWAARRPSTISIMIPRVGHHIARENPSAVAEAFLAFIRTHPIK
jgi:pimeloyl-ACP methyl ester carboxylesterase